MRILLLGLTAVFLVSTSLLSLTNPHSASFPMPLFGAWNVGEDAYADEVSDAGMSYVCRPFRWEQIEPQQDSFRFIEIDQWYQNVLEPNNQTAILLVRTGQCWATNNNYDPELGVPLDELASTPPLAYIDYYDYVHSLVDHLEGRIDHFIIEDDPLTKVSWYGTPEEYKLLVGVAYLAAKNANPTCTIIGNKFPAMAFGHLISRDLLREGRIQDAIDFWNGYYSRRAEVYQVDNLSELLDRLNTDYSEWLDNFAGVIMQPDMAENLDVIGYNYYMHYDYIDEVVAWLSMKMKNNGFSLPLWDLEHGIKDERDEVSDFLAAKELVKGYVLTLARDIPHVSWYPFAIDSSSHNFEKLHPMYDAANEEKLAPFVSMQVLADHVTPLHHIHDTTEGDYRRFGFINRRIQRVDLDVIWSDVFDQNMEIPFRGAAEAAVVTHFFGTAVETIPNVNGRLTIRVNDAPRYIQWLFE
jgi:hypothetical protein